MYLRTTQRRRKDGSLVRYLQLAHNRRVGGVTRAEVLLQLGREDGLDVEGLRRLARSIRRYTDPGAEEGGRIEPAEGLEVVGSRPLGGAWLLDALWRRLSIAETLGELLDRRRFTTDVERVLFALVANRALAPCSKLAAAEWASNDVAIPGLEAMDDDQAYRALDLLVEADAEAKVQEAVFFACADLLNLEVDLLFFDTTSTYFEAEPDTDGGEETDAPPFRALGHSKDHRPDLPQVVIGLAVTREGIPVRVWGRRTGFSGRDNLRHLRCAGGHDIAGVKLRSGMLETEAALSRQGRYRQVRDNLRVKEVRVGDGDGDAAVRYVVCHNPAEAERDRHRRAQRIARIEAELTRLAEQRQRTTTTSEREAHLRGECALRDHPTLSRYLRQTKDGRLVLDRAKIAAEERLDGKYLLTTSDPSLSAEEVALGYKQLQEAERSFRDLKGTLLLRPVFHRKDDRIHAHVIVCWLAVLLIRIAERATSQSWRRIATKLQRFHLVTLEGAAGTVQQTTRPTDAQHAILAALKVEPPPRITALEPA